MDFPPDIFDFIDRNYKLIRDYVLHNDAHARQRVETDLESFVINDRMPFDRFLAQYDQKSGKANPNYPKSRCMNSNRDVR